ncbi:hypothetical protein GOBAR_AA16674 [Gossypium barbadense]|uniref:Growth-regulating factor n=1 Tax=Gossypium barbadense TaxID=3634 RepID=A0A2P5XKV4_GOSBA|nr:hypothetical protein GOBAR_AA16674 [Gossypium barbadense]
MVSWCSWLSRQSNTLKVSGSSPGDATYCFSTFVFDFVLTVVYVASPYCIFFSAFDPHTDYQEMEPQYTPLKIARFADFGIGLTNMESNMLSGGEGSPPIGLGLELGRGSDHRPTGFTKSYLGCGPLHLEYKNGVDPEPGRCRRTDGKKWRCSKEAVPDHKYCERHMHRGRQRSRKLVEASQATSSGSRIIRHGNADTNLSISLQLDNSNTSSSGSSSNLSSGFIGFSPKSVLRGSNPKSESSIQFQEI